MTRKQANEVTNADKLLLFMCNGCKEDWPESSELQPKYSPLLTKIIPYPKRDELLTKEWWKFRLTPEIIASVFDVTGREDRISRSNANASLRALLPKGMIRRIVIKPKKGKESRDKYWEIPDTLQAFQRITKNFLEKQQYRYLWTDYFKFCAQRYGNYLFEQKLGISIADYSDEGYNNISELISDVIPGSPTLLFYLVNETENHTIKAIAKLLEERYGLNNESIISFFLMCSVTSDCLVNEKMSPDNLTIEASLENALQVMMRTKAPTYRDAHEITKNCLLDKYMLKNTRRRVRKGKKKTSNQ